MKDDKTQNNQSTATEDCSEESIRQITLEEVLRSTAAGGEE